jgi:two-component system, cell cycle response regulator
MAEQESPTQSYDPGEIATDFGRAKRQACLVVIAGTKMGAMYPVPEVGKVDIGRSSTATICIDDEGVSRRHAEMSITNRGVVLADLNSTNGTYVNGRRIVERLLRSGDKIQVGPRTILRFQYQDAVDEAFQRQLFESAVKDGLTGIYNKKYFVDRIEADVAYARRHKTALTLFMLDIDHFKNINDTYGHPAGDHVLKQVATLLRRTIRTEDIFARFGGEEFALLMRDVDDQKALMLAERMRRKVEEASFVFAGKRIAVTISIGIGTTNSSSETAIQTPAELIEQADQSLYRAKRTGRNRVVMMAA